VPCDELVSESKALATRCRRALSAVLGDVPRRRGSHDLLDVEHNLVGCPLEVIRAEFEAGAGRELKRKMRVPWSSSALCVNSFCRWRCENELGRLQVAGEHGFDSLGFERTFEHGIRGPRPHLDAELARDAAAGTVVVESKCLEPIDLSLKQPPDVSAQYAALAEAGDQRASSAWYGVLDQLESFCFLDAFQLVRHYLGFVRSGAHGPKTLVYLYWQPLNASHEVFACHREEIGRFASLVEGDATCAFQARTYNEHWDELEGLTSAPGWLGEHLRALRGRYAVLVD
jgi:hypothetical protein